MKPSKSLIALSVLVAVVATAAAIAGLFWQTGGEPFAFTTLHGRTIDIYGRGLYRNDWAFRAPIFRGTDVMLLLAGVPLLVASILLTRRGSLRGGFLLTGALSCFTYNGASLAFGAAYNDLYLLYVVYFAASLYAFVLSFAAIDLRALPARISPRLPHRWIAAFMFLAGLSPLVWLIDIVSALVEGGVPTSLAHYTTDVTTALDVGLIAPACFLAGALLLCRRPLGYLLSSTLLTLLTLVGLIVVGQTAMQLLDGIVLSAGEIAAFVVPFVTLSLIAVGLNVLLLRNIVEPAAEPA